MYDKSKSISTIVRYKLEQDTINLREAGLSAQKIADELNASGKIPEDEKITVEIVQRFLSHLPKLKREIIKRDQRRMVAVVNNSIDIISEMGELYSRAKVIMEALEEKATDEDSVIDPFRFKALSSEMREMLKQMTAMQKDLYDYNNTKVFMNTVMDVLQEVSPDAIPLLVEKLKMSRASALYGNVGEGRE